MINDLAAIAHAIPLLQPDDLHTLNAGKPVEGGAMAIIAPGTGLGEAFLVWDGAAYRGYASEGGHADFAPSTAVQMDLLRYLQHRFDHVSYEIVCSGLGIGPGPPERFLHAETRDEGLGACDDQEAGIAAESWSQ